MKKMNRREFGESMLVFMMANVLISCGGESSSPNPITAPSAPMPQPQTLVARVIESGYRSARSVVDSEYPGASRISINGEPWDVNWNFYVGGSLILVGSGSQPTADVANLMIPHTSAVEVRKV